MLGDSVVDVKHCMDPESGKVTPQTWGMLAAGAACVLVSAIAFYVSVQHRRVQQGRARLLDPRRAEAGVRVPRRAAVGRLRLARVRWPRARSRRPSRWHSFACAASSKSPYYRIGTAPGVEQPLVGAPTESFPLVAPRGDDFVFNFGAGMTGEMMRRRQADRRSPSSPRPAARVRRPTVAGAFELPIPLHARIRANVGQTSFLVSARRQAAHARRAAARGSRAARCAYFAGSLGAHLGLVLLLVAHPGRRRHRDARYRDAEPTDISSAHRRERRSDAGARGARETTAAPAPKRRPSRWRSTRARPARRSRPTSTVTCASRTTASSRRSLAHQAIEEARTAGVLGSVVAPQRLDAFASLTVDEQPVERSRRRRRVRPDLSAPTVKARARSVTAATASAVVAVARRGLRHHRNAERLRQDRPRQVRPAAVGTASVVVARA